ncbi:MAG: pilus assembly protein [Hyphomicrobiales bacterium]|nr:pilus assembly protein [Hyphomicrobiales bacterium]MDE2018626.1 pilus assembly protein [Hyphomicrobiales bacterium]
MTDRPQRLPKRPADLLRALVAARDDSAGMAAVEFALILPVMVAMYLGVVEVSNGYLADLKVAALSNQLVGLVAQDNTSGGIVSSDLSDYFASATNVMTPFTGSPAMTISSYVFPNPPNGSPPGTLPKALLDWTVTANGGKARTCSLNDDPSIPSGLRVAGDSVIVADVSYSYTPLVGSVFQYVSPGATKIVLSRTSYQTPRSHEQGTSSMKLRLASGVSGTCNPEPSFP